LRGAKASPSAENGNVKIKPFVEKTGVSAKWGEAGPSDAMVAVSGATRKRINPN
jgi:hypothetical protein